MWCYSSPKEQLLGHVLSSSQVKEGDIVEVDTVLKPGEDSREGSLVKRGRVVVKEIGPQTKKGGYHLTLIRYKQYALFRRNFSSWTLQISEHFCEACNYHKF